MAHLSKDHVQHLYDTFGELKVLDDIIRHRAADVPAVPILGYPRHVDSVTDYELFTGKDLDDFVNAACIRYLSFGLSPNEHKPIGLLAESNVDFIVSFFALSRLGYTVLCLSLRIPPVAIIKLLREVGCSTIIHGASQRIQASVREVQKILTVRSLEILLRGDYDRPPSSLNEPRFTRVYDRNEENEKVALIMHSSGSTGLPKPVTLTHRAVLTHPTQGSGYSNFNALPWYHLYGISTSLQAMWMRRTAYLYNTSLPLTADNLISVTETIKPDAIHAVPFVLGLLAENQRGVDILRSCKVVTSAGARTPDELGDRLVSEGVNLGVVFGTTEAGLLGDTMRRNEGDNFWNYIRIYANLRDVVYMTPLGHDNLFECVYLRGHPALSTSTSNSDSPAPGSWHSKDVFTPHPSIPEAWKYVTRLDDRITLVNGEKVLPLPIEGRIRQDALVREAVVAGVDKPMPCLLIFRDKFADYMSNEAYLDAVWPVVIDANSRAEAFSQITKEMIAILPADIEYPRTDKGNVIRAQVYKLFDAQIQEMYVTEYSEQGLKLDVLGLEDFVMKTFRDTIGVPLEGPETDFFSAGVDSLKAIQMRRILQRDLDINGKQLSTNVVYETGNARQLARYLASTETCDLPRDNEHVLLMQALIKKYSNFKLPTYVNGSQKSRPALQEVTNLNGHSGAAKNGISHDGGLANGKENGGYSTNGLNGHIKPKRNGYSVINSLNNGTSHSSVDHQNLLLTGVSGSVGAHVLGQAVTKTYVDKVYCLVRGANPIQRVFQSLEDQGLMLFEEEKAKIVAYAADLSLPDFGLDPTVFEEMSHKVSLVIHIAWPVNFNIHLRSFEPHIAGLHNLQQFALSVRNQPARLFFCSSVSVAFNTPQPARIPETQIEDMIHVGRTGYAQSKLVGEHIVLNAARLGAPSHVFRIGQVVGDTQRGIWNDKEFVPLMIRSALTLGVLPELDEQCTWLPVDTLATAMLEIFETLSSTSQPTSSNHQNDNEPSTAFYNLVNPTAVTWASVLTELREAGLAFETVPVSKWLRRLQDSNTSTSASADEASSANPATKLVDYYKQQYEADNNNNGVASGGSGGSGGAEGAGIVFATDKAQAHSAAMRQVPELIGTGYVARVLAAWMRRWLPTAADVGTGVGAGGVAPGVVGATGLRYSPSLLVP